MNKEQVIKLCCESYIEGAKAATLVIKDLLEKLPKLMEENADKIFNDSKQSHGL